MSKSKHFRVECSFCVEGNAIVAAKTEKEAIRKLRDRMIKHRRLKTRDFERESANAWEV